MDCLTRAQPPPPFSDGLDIYMSMVEDTMRSIKPALEVVLTHYKGQQLNHKTTTYLGLPIGKLIHQSSTSYWSNDPPVAYFLLVN